jgi:hypothetical protein
MTLGLMKTNGTLRKETSPRAASTGPGTGLVGSDRTEFIAA